MTFRLTSLTALALILTACGGADAPEPAEEAAAPVAPAEDMAAPAAEEEALPPSLEDVIGNVERRGEAAMARDRFRNPAETLAFFGLDPAATVIEISPGRGWYADILVPYVALNGGSYIGSYPEAFMRFADELTAKYPAEDYGDIQISVFGPEPESIAPNGSADFVLTFRNVHNWLDDAGNTPAFDAFYAALKPGGTLGVVEHRLPEDAEGAPAAAGYVTQSHVIKLAEEAGFVLEESAELNANPADTADHPYGVWTLPPVSRTPREGEETPEGFDAAAFLAIGESDRMTLRFLKPAE